MEENDRPATELVRGKVLARFPAAAAAEALRVVESYGGPDADRVRLAALRLAGSDLEALRRRMESARADYRDLLAWAEYPRQTRLTAAELRALPEAEQQALARADREEYEAWLRAK